ncbi:metal ABC transporter substrate-binding protein [candidate division KSB1 bacterium]
MKKLINLLIFVLVLSCGTEKRPGSEKINVITTIFPLKDITKNIGGDKVAVTNLLPSGSSPHTFEPTPGQIKELQRSDVCIRIGLDIDFWLDKMITSAGKKDLKIVTASEHVSIITEEEEEHEPGEEEHSDHEHKGGNPHIWLDPVIVKEIAKQITSALTEKLPAEKDYFEKNLSEYNRKLDELDLEIRDRVSGFSLKEFISMHSAWIYFAQRYGLKQAGVLTESPGKEPTPRYVADLIRTIKSINAKTVFAEFQLNPKLAETIAGETGTNVLLLDPLGDELSEERNTYIKLMKYNLKIMEEGLK